MVHDEPARQVSSNFALLGNTDSFNVVECL